MRCLVTAGPTFEPLDRVRRLTNFSTGRLGSELVNYLVERGHEATLLIGQQATHHGERKATHVETFTTTQDLCERLQLAAKDKMDAVFHAAAVSDFSFGKIYARSADASLTEVSSGKLSTRQGTLVAELVPTPKLIAQMREWYPDALLVGWKYEVDGGRVEAIRAAEKQMADCRTDACVVNGLAYGNGFGLVRKNHQIEHIENSSALYESLEKLMRIAK
jgi:phosphopantothenoylcysteine decarboxylase/phosphopantothenate--cysteine ligase